MSAFVTAQKYTTKLQWQSSEDVEVGSSPDLDISSEDPGDLLGSEAVEQSCATCLGQVVHAATGRTVRRIPRDHVAGFVQPDTVMVTDNGRSFVATGPVAACCIAASGREISAESVPVRMSCLFGLLPRPLTLFSVLVERGRQADVDRVAVQVIDIFRDQFACGVVPRTRTDAIASADSIGDLGGPAAAVNHHARAEVSRPCL